MPRQNSSFVLTAGLLLWLVLIGSSLIQGLATPMQESNQKKVNVHINSVSSVVANTTITISGVITDASTGEGLSGKVIKFNGTGATASLNQVVSQGIRFEDNKGITIESCPTTPSPSPGKEGSWEMNVNVTDDIYPPCTADVGYPEDKFTQFFKDKLDQVDIQYIRDKFDQLTKGDDASDQLYKNRFDQLTIQYIKGVIKNKFDELSKNRFNQVLYLNQGAKIIFPNDTKGVTLSLQGMGTNQTTVKVIENKTLNAYFIESSNGLWPNIANFNLMSPIGIQEIEILSVGNGTIPNERVGIGRVSTFDPGSNPMQKYWIDFEDMNSKNYGNQLEVASGWFFSSGLTPAKYSNSTEWTIQAYFEGDNNYPAAKSELRNFLTYEATWGGGGGGANLYPDFGTGITTIDCGANDNDKDGICNSWDTTDVTRGIPYTNFNLGTSYYSLCNNSAGCPDPNKVDIYLEIDNMAGHQPLPNAIQRVKDAFQAHTFGGKVIAFHNDT